MTTELILAGEKFADDRRWHVDTTLKILDLVSCYPAIAPLELMPSTHRLVHLCATIQLRALCSYTLTVQACNHT